MEQHTAKKPSVFIASVPGLDTIIVPRDDLRWNEDYASHSISNDHPHRYPRHMHKQNKAHAEAIPPTIAPRPWWMRLLVDSMLIPFVQGFMLNIGVHWVQYWRATGGVLGVFRRWRLSKKLSKQ